MKQILILIAISGLMLFSCCKNTPSHYTLDANLKAAFNFQVGSYWIYKDSISGRIDSFYVNRNIYASGTENSTIAYTYDFIDILILEKNINGFFTDTRNWEFNYLSNLIELVYTDSNVSGNKIFYAPLSNFPFQSTIHQNWPFTDFGNKNIKAINIYNSYSIGSQTYTNIEEINCSASYTAAENYPLPNGFSFNNWFYLCPGIGIVKMRLNQPQDSINRVWELLRYNVVM